MCPDEGWGSSMHVVCVAPGPPADPFPGRSGMRTARCARSWGQVGESAHSLLLHAGGPHQTRMAKQGGGERVKAAQRKSGPPVTVGWSGKVHVPSANAAPQKVLHPCPQPFHS
eukprot:jgi/Mesvir1/2213/Mv25168-RA.1